jgi:hypothetical protein
MPENPMDTCSHPPMERWPLPFHLCLSGFQRERERERETGERDREERKTILVGKIKVISTYCSVKF